MTIWQVVTNDKQENVIYQAKSAKEIAILLNISVNAIYTYNYRQKKQKCGRNKKYKIIKIVIDD